MGNCKHRKCNNTTEGRKHYCSERCKYWEGQLRKDENRHLPPLHQRNDEHFYAIISVCCLSGQGRRAGGTVKGGMSASILPTFAIQKVTDDNLRKHFSFSGVRAASLCGGGTITREAFYAAKQPYFNSPT
ncbi:MULTISPECIES: hypothetical protein [Vibrio]|uniref:hypothetical protein n=1 Tax=Vibrio TaxID=662 RepID=UPI002074F0DA|nr:MULTISPECIES: hypothetical protein [Vibrio]USD35470.1 hypothetical protein J8Z27_22895 [Vibrio sp. SCSIO 43186]USD72594.1 hypothetical protein J4N41_22900 [Vibrio sp. SCSIO 43139]